ncbi:unnamed protein product [Paramecium pentaurelia]|uniref:Uncharacterized protein n=1 Tax=Paramecium pentaurelia TaxID=43138 RepID=A0A8S1YH38_9CILI|nr:unnamed protein product [Paramecium pentaurelia]
MEQALKTLQTQSPTKQMQVVFINKNNLNRKYSPFQIQLNQSSKYQYLTEIERINGNQIISYQKNTQKSIIKKCTKDLQNKQLISMPQQLHQKLLFQKQKDLVQFRKIIKNFIIIEFLQKPELYLCNFNTSKQKYKLDILLLHSTFVKPIANQSTPLKK